MKENTLKRLTRWSLTLLVFILISCTEDDGPVNREIQFTWNKLGLEGKVINKLHLEGNKLYAITDKGLYVMNTAESEGFTLLGLADKNLLDIAIFSNEHIFASHYDHQFVALIYQTLDGGDTWEILENNFGGEYTEAINDFQIDMDNHEVLYGTGNRVIAKSLDKGTTWQPVWGDWGDIARSSMTIAINPKHKDEIWAGSQGAIENGYLLHLKDENEVKVWNDLVPAPTVVKEIVFDIQSPQSIYIGWEGELNRTKDNGSTWETLIERHEEAHFFFGIAISPADENTIFSGKWIKAAEEQSLIVYYCNDSGKIWKEITHASEKQGGILDMQIKNEQGKDRLFIGLDKGGVYELVAEK